MTDHLRSIKKPIQTELTNFHKHFKKSLKSDVPLLDRITYYIVQRKGKELRPVLVFLSARLIAPSNQSTYTAASLVEILHTATLVHDDVIDNSSTRRGFFSINALWKNKIAVLVGDYFFMRGFLLAMKNKEYDLLELVSEAVEKMSVGELLQLERARKLDIEEDIYFRIIKDKTASLISAACAMGAASVSTDQREIDKLKKLGELIGITFQIKDDLFDYGKTKIGKPRGLDIKEKKMTLPLIHALDQCSNSEKNKIKNLIKNKSEEKTTYQYVVDFVKNHGGIYYAEQKMLEYKNQSMVLLNDYLDSEIKDSFIALINYVLTREK